MLLNRGESDEDSPLFAQTRKQARALEGALRRQGHELTVQHAFAEAEPGVGAALDRAAAEEVERLIVLPTHPLCDPTTTVAALDEVSTTLRRLGWEPHYREVSGWHRHPDFARLFAESIRAHAHEKGVDVHAANTALVFAARGAPTTRRRDGVRYVEYVEELARSLAREIGRKEHEIGYTRAADARGKWTKPELGDLLGRVDVEHVVLVPLGEVTESSWTTAVLDAFVANGGSATEVHRVPVPHASPRLTAMFAHVAEDLLRPEPVMGDLNLRRCLCRGTPETFCLNAAS